MKSLWFSALLAAGIILPTCAFAVGPGPNEISSFGPDGGVFGDSSTAPGVFLDSFDFTVSPPPAGSSNVGLINVGMDLYGAVYGISGLTVSLFDGSTKVIGTETISSTTTGPFPGESIAEYFTTLPAGSYTLDVSGTFLKSGGDYSGRWIVAAVPEPSTWAALLVGLGLMTFVAKRRRGI